MWIADVRETDRFIDLMSLIPYIPNWNTYNEITVYIDDPLEAVSKLAEKNHVYPLHYTAKKVVLGVGIGRYIPRDNAIHILLSMRNGVREAIIYMNMDNDTGRSIYNLLNIYWGDFLRREGYIHKRIARIDWDRLLSIYTLFDAKNFIDKMDNMMTIKDSESISHIYSYVDGLLEKIGWMVEGEIYTEAVNPYIRKMVVENTGEKRYVLDVPSNTLYLYI